MTKPFENYTNDLFLPLDGRITRSILIRFRSAFNQSRTQSPYLSGDSFASIVDFDSSKNKKWKYSDFDRAHNAKSIFVKSDCFESLNFNLFPNARVIIAGNSDKNFDFEPLVPASVTLLLLQNASITSDRIRTLPIGLENRKLGRFIAEKDFYFDINAPERLQRCLVPPMSNTNPIRPLSIRKALELNGIFDVQVGYLSEREYLQLIRQYQFVLCLEGNGYENHRVWECLYLGIFPIVLRSAWSITLKSLNLPILFADRLEDITEDVLRDFASQNEGYDPRQSPSLWIDYWKDLVCLKSV